MKDKIRSAIGTAALTANILAGLGGLTVIGSFSAAAAIPPPSGTANIRLVDDVQPDPSSNHLERNCRSLGPKWGVACTQWTVVPGPYDPGRGSIWVNRPLP
jgi:hypothetical protein